MTEKQIVKYCAPTLAGIKTGSMFCCAYDSKESVMDSIRSLNKKLTPSGIYVVPLRFSEQRVLVYMCRPKRLEKDLENNIASGMLKKLGYQRTSIENCLSCLKSRVGRCEQFPHEVGLFLGYPPEDVECFVKYEGRHCKCSGQWKVYNNEEQAKKIFALYKKCTNLYCQAINDGVPLEQLAVSA